MVKVIKEDTLKIFETPISIKRESVVKLKL